MKAVVFAAVLAIGCASAWAGKPEGTPGKGPGTGGTTSSQHVNDNALLNANDHASFKAVSPVPEAESVVLAIAGVAVVGVAAWRRRNRK